MAKKKYVPVKVNKSTTGEMGYTLPVDAPSPSDMSFVPPQEDGALDTYRMGGYYGTYLDLDGASKSEQELIKRYRDISVMADVDMAIEDIVNESIANIDEDPPVELNLDGVDKKIISESIKEKIFDEFKKLLKIMQFDMRAHDYFRRWYIDGRINFHKVIDVDRKHEGIQDIRYIDPRKIKKVREIEKVRDPKTGVDFIKGVKEFFIFNAKGLGNVSGHGVTSPNTQGLKITKDSIAFCPSGLADQDNNMVLSYLHVAIKPANQLRMMENSLVIYRLARAPERRIFYVDVGNLPKLKAEQYLKDTMNRFRNKITYDACLAMDTKIPLLDGRILTLEECQAEHEAGKELWVYSCDPVTGKVSPGLVTSAGITKFNQEMVRLTLDNDKTITCTLDHKFPVWEKGKVEAKNLVVGDSMIPHYTRNKPIQDSKSEYQQIFDPDQKKWIYTHRLVSQWKDANDIINEWTYNDEYLFADKNTVHHKNYDRFNNDPSNLVRMARDDHFDYHTQHNSEAGKLGGVAAWKTNGERWKAEAIGIFAPRSDESRREASRRAGTASFNNKSGIHDPSFDKKAASNLGTIALREKMKDEVFYTQFCATAKASWDDERRDASAERGRLITKEQWQTMNKMANIARWETNYEENRARLVESQSIEYPSNVNELVETCTMTGCSASKVVEYVNTNINADEWANLNSHKYIRNRKSLMPFCYHDLQKVVKRNGFVNWSVYRETLLFKNHKIVKIEFLDERMDVGTLGIDKNEIYHANHTFALDAGIYTCNSTGALTDDKRYMSMLEDFWLARREGGKGTEIDTLPGGENLGQIDDVLFFQKKLYQALRVPMSRLEQQGGLNFGRAAEITRDELKFVKFIDKLQKRFSLLFQDLLRTQLLLKGIMTEEEWDKIHQDIRYTFAQDAYYAEAKKQEILKSRYELLAIAVEYQGVYFSKKFVQKEILRMTDEDIAREEKEMAKEPVNPLGAGGMMPGGGNPESDPEYLDAKDEKDKDHELKTQKIDHTQEIKAIKAKPKPSPKKK